MRPGSIPLIFSILTIAHSGEATTLLDASSEGYPVHHAPYALASGDIDGNGIDDLVVADGDGAAILLASPDSTFQVQQRLALGPVSAMTIARVTDDPYADLIVLPTDRTVVRIFPGLGNGSFATSFDLVFLAGANGIVARDFDGDGRADIAASAVSTVSVWRATGAGFTSPQSFGLASAAAGLIAGDVDGDGDVDLVVPLAWTNGFAVLRNQGSGSFAPAVVQSSPTPSTLAACADFNGDGVDDVAITEPTGSLEAGFVDVFPGLRDGTFGARFTVASAVPRPGGSAAGDVDRDGYADLVVVTTGGFAIHRGSSSGLGPSGPLTVDRSLGIAITLGAFDRDRYADLAIIEGSTLGGLSCAPYEGSAVYVFRGDPQGGFHEPPPIAGVTEARGLVASDIDGDGVVDLFVTTPTPGIVALHGRPDGGFDAFPKLPLPFPPAAVHLVDVDGNGGREVVVSGGAGVVPGQIVIHDVATNGSLVARAPLMTGLAAGEFASGDYNSDGLPDFAVVDTRLRALNILLSENGGSWTAGPRIGLIFGGAIVATDSNGDGKTDLAVSTYGGGDFFTPVWVNLLGHGDGTFEFGMGSPRQLDSKSAELAPPNGGDPAIAVAEGRAECLDSEGGIALATEIRGELFFAPLLVSTGASPARVRLGDVTGDGRLDLVSCTELGRLVVNVGEKDGFFSDRLEFGVPGGVVDFGLADVDRDGVLDLIAGGPRGVFLLHNKGGAHVDSSRIAARIGAGAPESILTRDRDGTVTLCLASDTRHDATRLDLSSVRLEGARPIPSHTRFVDEVTRSTYPGNVCDQIDDFADGLPDVEVGFPATDVLAGWLTAAGFESVPPDARQAVLTWTARDNAGRVHSGTACAIVIGDNDAVRPVRLAAYGPMSDRDLGVGVTLDVPVRVGSSEVTVFDIAGRRVTTLYRGPLAPGFHRLAWTAERPRPGIYFARARVDETVLTTRVLVLR